MAKPVAVVKGRFLRNRPRDGFKKKLKAMLNYWLHHNKEHDSDEEKWIKKIEEHGFSDAAEELKKIRELSKQKNERIENMIKKLEDGRGIRA